MSSTDQIDFSTLTWVKSELDETLNRAKDALKAYVEDSEDTNQLQFCVTYLHQVQGTLKMVELYGASMVAEEMEFVAKDLIDDNIKDKDAAYDILLQSILRLPDYLERIELGHKDVPIVLLPLVNDLRAVRSKKLLSESALFNPNLTLGVPDRLMDGDFSMSGSQLKGALTKIRTVYQVSLLNWIKQINGDKALSNIQILVTKLQTVVSALHLKQMFWVYSAVIEGLRARVVEDSISVKQVAGQVDLLLHDLILDPNLSPSKTNPITKNLLYFIASCPGQGRLITEVKNFFELEQFIPDEEEIKHAEGSLSGKNKDLLQTVSEAINDDILVVQESLDLYIRNKNASSEQIAPLLDTLQKIADTLGILGLGVAREGVLLHQGILKTAVDEDSRPTDDQLLDVAKSLLMLESQLGDHIQSLGGSPSKVEEDEQDHNVPKTEQMAILKQLAKESIVNLQQIKSNFVAYIESPWDKDQINENPKLLQDIAGALKILQLDQASEQLTVLIAYVKEQIIKKKATPSAVELDQLATTISTFEYYLENLDQGSSIQSNLMGKVAQQVEKLQTFATDDHEVEDVASEINVAESNDSVDEDTSEVVSGQEQENQSESTESEHVEAQSDSTNDELTQVARSTGELVVFGEDVDDEFKEIFLEEYEEELANLKQKYAAWKTEPDAHADEMGEMRRIYHTLKGSGRMVGAELVGEFGWQMENMCNRYIEEGITISDAFSEMMNTGVSMASEMFDALKNESELPANYACVLENAHRISSGETTLTTVEPELVDESIDEVSEEIEVSQTDSVEELSENIDSKIDIEDDISLDLESLEEELELEESDGQEAETDSSGEPILEEVLSEEVISEEIASEEIASDEKSSDGEEMLLDLDDLDLDDLDLEDLDLEETISKDVIEETATSENEAEDSLLDVEDFEFDLNEQEDSLEEETNEVSTASETENSSDSIENEKVESLDEAFELELDDIDIDDLEVNLEEDDSIENMDEEEAEVNVTSSEDPLTLELDDFEFDLEESSAEGFADAQADDKASDQTETLSDEATYSMEFEATESEDADALSETEDELLSFDDIDLSEEDTDSVSDDELEEIEEEATDKIEASTDDESELDELNLDELTLDDIAIETNEQDNEDSSVVEEIEEAELESDDLKVDPVFVEILQNEVGGHLSLLQEFIDANNAKVTEEFIRVVHTLNGAASMAEVHAITHMATPLEKMAIILSEKDLPFSDDDMENIATATKQAQLVMADLAEGKYEADASVGNYFAERIELLKAQPVSGEPVVDSLEDVVIDDIQETEETVNELLDEDLQLEVGVENSEHVSDEPEVIEQELVVEETVDEEADIEESIEEEAVVETAKEQVAPLGVQAEESEESLQSDFDDELLEILTEEAGEIFDRADHLLTELEDKPEDMSLIQALQRDLHTLKGGARMAGLSQIGDLSHQLESLFESIAEKETAVTAPQHDMMSSVMDKLHNMVQSDDYGQLTSIEKESEMLEKILSDDGTQIQEESQLDKEFFDPLNQNVAPVEVASESEDSVQADEAPKKKSNVLSGGQIKVNSELLDKLVNFAGEVSIYRSRMEQQSAELKLNIDELENTVERVRRLLRELEHETEAQIISTYQHEGDELEEDFDPLELDQFSTIQQLSRSLAESVSDLSNIQNYLQESARSSETLLLQQSRVNTELQEGLMETRLVTFNSLVPRLRRVLRTASTDLDKKAKLTVKGAEGEMDKTVLEGMQAPLEHMIRNSMVHGLEKNRKKAGKPEQGNIEIALSREATEVVVTVSDDGAGINTDVVKAKAIERGIIDADSDITDQEVAELITHSGLSAADDVTKLAGRGVGMDVVSNEVKRLGGGIEILSRKGEGTTFVIRLPYTLALTQAIVVQVADHRYAIPASGVEGLIRMNHDEFKRRIADGELDYDYAGDQYRIQELNKLLSVDSEAIVEGGQVPLVMIKTGDQGVALRVDQTYGGREIVVKSVGTQVASVPGIFGATILGDGAVVLILDIIPMHRAYVQKLKSMEEQGIELVEEVEEDQAITVMVVDDSITMRRAGERMLTRNDFEVLTAKDGLDALNKLQEQVPDLMLLDIEMPRMDGFELATQMKQSDKFKDIPIIMITSRTGQKHKDRANEIGVERYLGKPYQEIELLENINDLLNLEDVG